MSTTENEDSVMMSTTEDDPNAKRVSVQAPEEDEDLAEDDHIVRSVFGTHDLNAIGEDLKRFDIFSEPNTKSLIASVAGEFEPFLGCNRFSVNKKALRMINLVRANLLKNVLETVGEECARTHGCDPAHSPATVVPGAVYHALRRLTDQSLSDIQ
jgi:hypothetical protein